VKIIVTYLTMAANEAPFYDCCVTWGIFFVV